MANKTLTKFSQLIALLMLSNPLSSLGSEFYLPEPTVISSPDSLTRLDLPEGEIVADLDVSPQTPEALVLITPKMGPQKVMSWEIKSNKVSEIWAAPAGVKAKSLVWHPVERAFFVLGMQGKQSVLMKIQNEKTGWTSHSLYETQETLRRLIIGPRPFITDSSRLEYRLFFSVKDSSGGYSLHSITESGHRRYQVIGKKPGLLKDVEDYQQPSSLVSRSAMPTGFFPAGDVMLWEDSASCFEKATYGTSSWAKKSAIMNGKLCGGTITATPNGIGLLHWNPGKSGLDLLTSSGNTISHQAENFSFAFTPSSVPDGKGVVGVVGKGGRQSVIYVPIKVPLADVTNAWMFVETPDDLQKFSDAGGLLRNTNFDQMYNLYDTENYSCGDYNRNLPTRPYLVTTDAFWEVYAAAFEGLFVTTEKRETIPAFWNFIDAAAQYYSQSGSSSSWKKVFIVLKNFRIGALDDDGEVKRIQAAQGLLLSPVLKHKIDYGELKPRGNYASNPEFQSYFKAFTYLTRFAADGELPLKDLNLLPDDLKQKAGKWINPYRIFIAASRSPSALNPNQFVKPAYNKFPEMLSKIFPLSWGMDNEILNSVVYHDKWPEEDQVIGPHGERLLASVVDLPAAMDNRLSQDIVSEEIKAYPKLEKIFSDLRNRPWPIPNDSSNLYDRWMDALKIQWASSPALPINQGDWKMWDAKRLQTGLASWATLRHATVLVNESSGAECGEGGYEEIVMRPPRGYVEPDPRTFTAIANLFDAAYFSLLHQVSLGDNPDQKWKGDGEALRKGLLQRLNESSDAARLFSSIAMKELRNEALLDTEYTAILSVGRVAEHHFLVYKSLSTEGMGLATPDPIAKIADVAHGPDGKPYVMAAVGRPMEWNQTVPFFGRRELVKGPTYSFYEFTSDTLFNDKEWQGRLSSQARPAWIRPFVSNTGLSCPPKPSF